MDALAEISGLSPTGAPDAAAANVPPVTRRLRSRVSRNTFFVCAGISLLILAFCNVLIQRMARTSRRQQFMAALATLPKDTDLLFLGNSLVEAGCDVQVFQQSWTGSKIRPENMGLSATFPTEHCLILHRAFQSGARPKYVVYGFFDDELIATPTGNFSDLTRNRALAYYFPDEAAEMYAPGSIFKKWQMRAGGWLPMISERSTVWNEVDYVRQRVEDIGMPRQARNRFGFVEKSAALEADDARAFEKRCVSAARGTFSVPVQKIIQMTREQGGKLVLVEMPMSSRHRRLFYSTPAWSVLREQMQQSATINDLLYISAADWITNDNEFEDVIHLNEAGARNFSAKLAQVLQRLPYMPKDIAAAALNAEN